MNTLAVISFIVLMGLQARFYWAISKHVKNFTPNKIGSPTKAALTRAPLPKHAVLIGQRREHGKGIG